MFLHLGFSLFADLQNKVKKSHAEQNDSDKNFELFDTIISPLKIIKNPPTKNGTNQKAGKKTDNILPISMAAINPGGCDIRSSDQWVYVRASIIDDLT